LIIIPELLITENVISFTCLSLIRRVHRDFMLRGWFGRSCILVPHIATLMQRESIARFCSNEPTPLDSLFRIFITEADISIGN
jgi:hypothetical protein